MLTDSEKCPSYEVLMEKLHNSDERCKDQRKTLVKELDDMWIHIHSKVSLQIFMWIIGILIVILIGVVSYTGLSVTDMKTSIVKIESKQELLLNMIKTLERK